MHELGMCDGIIEAVQRHAAGRRVARVRIRVGTLQRVVEPAMQQAFEHAAEGTEAEGAQLDIVVLPVRAFCRSCASEFESEDVVAICANCGGVDIELRGGEELVLECIEYETTNNEAA
jgi:hydrogenase nickel incorporation protein HypA/HybF